MLNKNKRLIIESNIIKECLNQNLTLKEFLLLSYFDNAFDLSFDLKLIMDVLQMKEEDVLESYSNLLSKKLLRVETIKNDDGRIYEKVSLEPFYQLIILNERRKDKVKEKEDIYTKFENEFGRTLSATDYERINDWIDNKGYSEELILAAVKEATDKGVTTLRYIDKILFDWNKKGFKKVEDINEDRAKEDIPSFETEVMNFDWLNEGNRVN